jgi:hypothetical protein
MKFRWPSSWPWRRPSRHPHGFAPLSRVEKSWGVQELDRDELREVARHAERRRGWIGSEDLERWRGRRRPAPWDSL